MKILEPRESLRCNILHLLLCAFNKDVDLYDSLSWVRAYENYVNVALTNHGHHGGSFAWSPRHSHHKEIAKLRGQGLFVVADVDFPVRGLKQEQIDGTQNAVERARQFWSDTGDPDKGSFKSPPPGFPGRDDD